MERPQLVIISGPTATGKTALAIELADRYGAEIISADSRQIYRYMNIGTAKPSLEQQARIPHHLLDVADPDERFDTARFRGLAVAAIDQILQRGKRVLVVGGTGLYVRALTRGLFPGPPADHALRTRLQEQEQAEGKGFLHRWLREVDSEAAARLHPHDTVRLIRALEVYLVSGTPISHWQQSHGFREQSFSTLAIGLIVEREALAQRIEQRCRQMIRDGLIDEVCHLWELGYRSDLASLQTIGYAQVIQMLQGQYRLEDALTQMSRETRRLAKRQLTWLRAESAVHWFAPTQGREIATTVEEFLSGERRIRGNDVSRI